MKRAVDAAFAPRCWRRAPTSMASRCRWSKSRTRPLRWCLIVSRQGAYPDEFFGFRKMKSRYAQPLTDASKDAKLRAVLSIAAERVIYGRQAIIVSWVVFAVALALLSCRSSVGSSSCR